MGLVCQLWLSRACKSRASWEVLEWHLLSWRKLELASLWLNAVIWKEKKNIICFPVACVLFLFLSRKLLCYRAMYVGSVGTVCNLAKVEALKLLDKF